MKEIDPKYVTSTRPVNLRTAHKMGFKVFTVPSVVRARLAATKARNRFGRSMQDQLRLPASTAGSPPLPSLTILGVFVGAASAMALLLGWIQQSIPFATLGVLGLLGGLLLAMRGTRSAEKKTSTKPLVDALFSGTDLQNFDLVLEQLASDIPDELAMRLLEIKQEIIGIARKADSTGVDEHFTVEDRMYMIECIRRYLPDSLQSYLLVPQNQRATHLITGNQTAVSLLVSQLNLVNMELKKRNAKLIKSAAAQLLRQQRFLESKTSR